MLYRIKIWWSLSCLNSLRDEIKELWPDIKICMEKIKIPLNEIVNCTIKRQVQENEGLNVDINFKPIIEIQGISQNEVIIQQIENYETVRRNINMRYLLTIYFHI